MKKIGMILAIFASLVACKTNDKKTTGVEEKATADIANFTSIQWIDSTFKDLGKREQGKEIEISFRFKNTGTKNLVIESVNAQCGCTIPEQPVKPFVPGEEGFIKARYNGNGHGETRKQVYVKGNMKPYGADTLTFRAEMTDKQ